MKAVVLALVCLGAIVSAFPSVQEKHALFATYLTNHQRVYSDAEYLHRFEIFSRNVDLVHRHNEEYAAGKHSFHLALNQFADKTNEEYRRLLGTRASRPSVAAVSCGVAHPNASIPSTVDWTKKGVVTPVKDQGQCGSCWSFSATGSMEGAHALATGSLLSFSEQNMVDCVNNGANTCSAGGEMQDAFAFAITYGIESESEYPYCACSGNTCEFSPSKVVAKFSSCYNVTAGDENALKAAVAQQPVSIAIDASSIWFQLYGGGVFNYAQCKNSLNDLDHGVLAVGYGTDNGQDYWLVKNSWGGSWGLSGYIMMSRNKSNQCGVATDASYITYK